MDNYDVIIIGGGPAGLMAAAAAGRRGARTLLLEKGERLGRKLIISGGGRCNVTNRKPPEELIRDHIPGNGRFMYSPLHAFGSEEIIAFFEGLGIALKEEDRGRMFPVTDRAITVANALIDHIRTLGVQIRQRAPVDHLLFEDGRVAGVALRDGAKLGAGSVVVAVGGCSVPATGSTGDGYPWARQAGHTITTLYPAEVPIRCCDPFIAERELQGLSLRAISQTLYDPSGKAITTQTGDMLFTHFGISGPASLRTSHYVSRARQTWGDVPLRLTVNLFPGPSADDLYAETMAALAAAPKKAVKNVLPALLPERLVPVLLRLAGVDEYLTHAHVPKPAWQQLCRLLGAFPLIVVGTLPLADAFVTGGGVAVKEVDPRTMGSRLTPGLFFAGEVLDVHAHTGGYNITIAFSTGWIAGASAADHTAP